MIYTSCLSTAMGTLQIQADDQAITYVQFIDMDNAPARTIENSLTRRAAGCLKEYFAGTRRQFDLPLRPAGTEFQRDVWDALLSVPYGTTKTYRSVSEMVGRPKACRAAGAAIGKNPILILIPCHRIIGSDGGLCGFAAGVERKKQLLALEGVLPR